MPKRLFPFFARYGRPYVKRYAAGVGLALFFVALNLISPLIMRSLVNDFACGEMTRARLWGYFGLLAAPAPFPEWPATSSAS